MKNIDIIGVPSTFGQRKLGVNLGPDAIRYAGLQDRLENIGINVHDKGNIDVPAIDLKKFNSEQQGLEIMMKLLMFQRRLAKK